MIELIVSFRRVVSALLYYSWRALRGRPGYIHQTDSKQTHWLFLSLYIASSCLSLSIIHGGPNYLLYGVGFGVAVALMGNAWVGKILKDNLCTESLLPIANACGALALAYLGAAAVHVVLSALTGPILANLFIFAALAYIPTAVVERIRNAFDALPQDIKKAGYKPETQEPKNE